MELWHMFLGCDCHWAAEPLRKKKGFSEGCGLKPGVL